MTLFSPKTHSPQLQPASNVYAERCLPQNSTRAAQAPDQASQLRALIRAAQPASGARAESSEAPRAQGAHAASGRRARVIAITSGKGGVGKTNLAVNLAARFAQCGRRTLLLDADMGLANADLLCGLDLRHNLSHVIARKMTLADVVAAAPGGFRLIGGASGLATMADLPESEHRRLLGELAQLQIACDVVLIDTGAGINPSVLAFAGAADHVLVVTTPEPPAIADAYATIKVMTRRREALDDRPISLLVNQARSASEARRVYERIAKVSRSFLGKQIADAGFLPADLAVAKAVRKRSPFVISYPRCAASVCVTRVARRLEAGLTVPKAAQPGSRPAGLVETLAKLLRPRPTAVFP